MKTLKVMKEKESDWIENKSTVIAIIVCALMMLPLLFFFFDLVAV